MIDYFWRVVPLLWPHALLILATSWFGVRSRTLAVSAFVGIAGAAVATVMYYVIQNGIAPDRQALIPGQFLALFVAGGLSLLAASIASYSARQRGVGAFQAILIGAVVGLLFLVPMPTLQLGLGCGLTGVCP